MATSTAQVRNFLDNLVGTDFELTFGTTVGMEDALVSYDAALVLSEAAISMAFDEPLGEAIDRIHELLPAGWRAKGGLAVARGEFVQVNPGQYPRINVIEALDEESADMAEYCPMFDGDGMMVPDLEAQLEGFGTGLLIMDRVNVWPAWRGRRLGPLLAGAMVNRVGVGCRAVACFPAPIEEEDVATEAKRAAAQARLRRIWQQVGFRPWRDGVHVLDPGQGTWEEAYATLLETAGAPAEVRP